MALGAHYQINQAANGTPTGTTDVARIDIYQSQLVHLVGDSSSAQVSPVWTILAWPEGAAHTQPTNPTTFDATYTFPTPGSYLIEFLVNNGLGVNATRFVVGVTRDANGLVYDDGVREPVFGERLGDDTASSNDRGWAKAYETALARAMPAISTVAALLAMRPNRHKHVHLLGYYAPGDGGGGDMYWDATNNTAHEGGIVFQPGFGTAAALGTGRWVRRYTGKVMATWFGAIADGRGVPGGNVGDANIGALGNTLTCTNIAFTTADIGKTVSVPKAKNNVLPGTVDTTNGSRGVLYHGADPFLPGRGGLWTFGQCRVNGVDGFVAETATGTVSITTANTTLTGSGTLFLTELWIGAEVAVYGSGLAAAQKFLITAIASNTSATINALPRVSASGQILRVVPGPDRAGTGTVDIVTGTKNLVGHGTLFVTELVPRIAGVPALIVIAGNSYFIDHAQPITNTTATLLTNALTTSTGVIFEIEPNPNTLKHHFLLNAAAGATTTGQSMQGARGTLVTTISSVGGGVATLAASADFAVVNGPMSVFTDNVTALQKWRDSGLNICLNAARKTRMTGDTALLGPNAYGIASELIFSAPRSAIHLEKSATFVQAASITLDATEIDFIGQCQAYTFDLNQVRQSTNLWVGQPGREVMRVSNTIGVSASGTMLRGISIQQIIETTANSFIAGPVSTGEFGGTGGVVGLRLGISEGAAAGGGFDGLIVSDCQVGVNFEATLQQTRFSNLRVCRSDGYANFSSGAGLLIAGTSQYFGGNTAFQVESGSVQGNRTGIQIGTIPYANGADTLQIGPGCITIENFPSNFPCKIMHLGGNVSWISGLHTEMEHADTAIGPHATDKGTWYGIQLGGPNKNVRSVVINGKNYLTGDNTSIAIYGCDTADITQNYFDTSGGSSPAHPPLFGRNFRGGLRQSNIHWHDNLAPGPGADAPAKDVDFLDGTGHSAKAFGRLHTYNLDPLTNLTDPKDTFIGKREAEVYQGVDGGAYTIAGSKTITGTTAVAGNTDFGAAAALTGTDMPNFAMTMTDGAAASFTVDDTSGLFVLVKHPPTVGAQQKRTYMILQQKYYDGTGTADASFLFLPSFTHTGDTTPKYRLDMIMGAAGVTMYFNGSASAANGAQVSFSFGQGTPPKFYQGTGAPNVASEAAKIGETAVVSSQYSQFDGTAAGGSMWFKNDTGWHIWA